MIVPNGTAAIVIIKVIIAVPTIAGKIPPLVIPSLGNSVKNDQVKFGIPPIIVTVKIATITKTQPALTDRSTNLATTAWTLGSLANQTPLTSSFSLVNGVVNFNNAYSGVAVMNWNSVQTTIAAWTFSNPQLYVNYTIFLTTTTAVTINKPTTGGCISNMGSNMSSVAGAKWKIDVVWDGTNYFMDFYNYT